MCRAVDVASYILQEKGRLTGYQLQKLLYYSQAWCLVTQDRPLFSEVVRAWANGPVVYDVYTEHAGKYTVAFRDVSGSPDNLSAQDVAVVDAVLDSYGVLSGDDLRDLSHHEDPWRDAYDGTSSLQSPVITSDAMTEYYSSLMGADRWELAAHHVPHFSYAPHIAVSDAEYDWLASIV